MSRYRNLSTVALTQFDTIERPDHSRALTLDYPALEVFTDFRVQQPLMLEQTTPLEEAIELMKRTHEKLKLVIDAGETFRGVISLADLLSVKVLRASQATGLHRRDLTVAEVMTPREALHAVDYRDLAGARIGDLLTTMKNVGDSYILVVESDRRSIRGVLAASDIARGLQIPLHIGARANTFSDIYRVARV